MTTLLPRATVGRYRRDDKIHRRSSQEYRMVPTGDQCRPIVCGNYPSAYQENVSLTRIMQGVAQAWKGRHVGTG